MDSECKDLWQTVDYKGRIVTLTEERLQHIIDGRFGADRTWSEAIKKTVEEADIVIPGRYDDTEVHIKKVDSGATIQGKWLHVPVGYQGQFGDVRTAIPKDELSKADTNLYIRPDIWNK